jgi:hypothetical protein
MERRFTPPKVPARAGTRAVSELAHNAPISNNAHGSEWTLKRAQGDENSELARSQPLVRSPALPPCFNPSSGAAP